ncbi:MAG: glutamate synthase [Deltaproteobacteria bacterium]|nr:MAG: glutamate synthase [Deltaproteobacteria bacterium]
MAELHPYPFAALIRRAFGELESQGSIFDLSARKFAAGSADHDLSVTFHGRTAASPLGPAAGPHTQMAQNITLAWLGGCRIFELKTVQILDELKIARPCIDMQTIGYNVEWSQELKLEQSLEEYVKASMLIELLAASGKIPMAPGFDRFVFDMSVGYDLAGIKSERVQAFIDGMKDASAVVERLRAEIPAEFGPLRDLDFTTKLSDTLTLSTFHGCPPDEIERIIDFLLREKQLHCVVKLNPTLNGPEGLRGLLHDKMGYDDVIVPDHAFEDDTKWHQVEDFIPRLGETADALGLGFGVKFSNTLVCENHRGFFPDTEKTMYMSGPPLHVLAMKLVQKFRGTFGDRWPISFSAGIDKKNFADALAIGLVPITTCSDLLLPGGYGRAEAYGKEAYARMSQVGAKDVEGFILRAYGKAEAALDAVGPDAGTRAKALAALAAGDDLAAAVGEDLVARWVSAAQLLNTDAYVDGLEDDPRYGKAKNSKVPKKVGSKLWLFECVTCDKCVPVCPNDANFTLAIPPMDLPVLKATAADGGFTVRDEGPMRLVQKHQIGNFADFCNECGNCDVFCPEDGGPYVLKPRFFGSVDEWRRYPDHDGFHVARHADRDVVHARVDGAEMTLELAAELAALSGTGYAVTFHPDDPAGTLAGHAEPGVEVDLAWFFVLRELLRATLDAGEQSWVSAAAGA